MGRNWSEAAAENQGRADADNMLDTSSSGEEAARQMLHQLTREAYTDRADLLASGAMVPERNLRIVRQLASKPLSAVYAARDEKQRLRIVKQFVLPVESEENNRMRELFKRECELLQSLDQPAVCRVVEVFDQGNSSFLALEHSPGEDLQTLVSLHGQQAEESVIDWAKQLCAILTHLHSKNVIHRDLTPDNIVMDEDNSLRLIDFGVAHQFLEGVTGTLIGKQCYVAPEQLRGKAGPRSDIYSFGGTCITCSQEWNRGRWHRCRHQ
jgi:serine/threonine-protein kinase